MQGARLLIEQDDGQRNWSAWRLLGTGRWTLDVGCIIIRFNRRSKTREEAGSMEIGISTAGWFLVALYAAGTIFWIWMIVDCAIKEPGGIDKTFWILWLVMSHVIGALMYLLVRRPKRIKQFGR